MPSDNAKAGHRKRLRDKFLKAGLVAFHDYEILGVFTSDSDDLQLSKIFGFGA